MSRLKPELPSGATTKKPVWASAFEEKARSAAATAAAIGMAASLLRERGEWFDI
jgi:hypothetical protein